VTEVVDDQAAGGIPARRHSLDFVSWKDREPVAASLKEIYRAVDADAGEAALTAFEEDDWGKKYPAIGQSWRRAWGEVIPFYAFPGDGVRFRARKEKFFCPIGAGASKLLASL
jgi:hypothetical protein